MINFRELAQKGVHFGHQTSRWCPKMAPYIWGAKNKTHLIDISKTAYQLAKAADFLKGLASEGKLILWVGTKKAAQEIVKNAATELNMPFVTRRWIGGTLSNYAQVKKSVTKYIHIQEVVANAEKISHYTKKELSIFQKVIDRLEKNVGGLCKLAWPVAALVVVDVKKEQSAILEARQMGVPVIGIVDTNSDPSLVDYVIPGNDDAPESINILISHLKAATLEGLAVLGKTKEVAAVEEVAKVAFEKKEDAVDLLLDLPLEEEQDGTAAKKVKKQSAATPPSQGKKRQ